MQFPFSGSIERISATVDYVEYLRTQSQRNHSLCVQTEHPPCPYDLWNA